MSEETAVRLRRESRRGRVPAFLRLPLRRVRLHLRRIHRLTFIDFEHFIIPDEITLGGTIAGVLLCFAIPTLHGQDSNVAGGLWSLVGAGAGFAALWLVVQLGKMAFGKKRLTY